jgi:hypothetical protein
MDRRMHMYPTWLPRMFVSLENLKSILEPILTLTADEFPYLPEANHSCSPAIYRFRFLVEVFMQRIPSECRSSLARQAQDGVCSGRSIRT